MSSPPHDWVPVPSSFDQVWKCDRCGLTTTTADGGLRAGANPRWTSELGIGLDCDSVVLRKVHLA